MPHETIAEMSGNCHVRRIKGSPFEHNTHEYDNMHSPMSPNHAGIDAAVRKEKRIAGIKE